MTHREMASTLKRAVEELSRRCDGARSKDDQGFNAVDTSFGRELAALPLEEWGDATVVTARRMLHKYADQLESYGVDIRALPEPEEIAGEGEKATGERPDWWTRRSERGTRNRVVEEEGKIALYFEYDEALIEEIKDRARGRSFNRSSKAWLLHFNARNAGLALELARREGWEIDEHLTERLEQTAAKSAEEQGEKDSSEETWQIRKVEGEIRIEFGYVPALNGEIKSRLVPRKWDGENEVWTTETNPRNAFVLLDLIESWDFEVQESLRRTLKEAAEGVRSERQARWSDQEEKAVLLFPRAEDLLRKVKALPQRSFVPAEDGGPQWEVPLTMETAPDLLEILGTERFQVSEELSRALDDFGKRVERRLQWSQWDGTGEEAIGPLDVEDELSYDLYEYQRAGVLYAQEEKGVLIGDQMGLGKTISALATVHSEDAYPLLVVCPASVKSNWIREAYQCLPVQEEGITLSMLDGMDPDAGGTTEIRVEGESGDVRRIEVPLCDLEADIITTNYAILGPYMDRLIDRGFQSLVVDESHKIKNRDAKRSKRCARLAKQTEYQLLLTGTPVRNRPKELFNQLRLVGAAGNENRPFGTFFPWAKRYCNATRTRWGWDFSGASNTEALNRALRARCYVRREKTDVADDLPSLQEEEVEVGISNRKEYERAERDVLRYLRQRLENDPEYFERVAEYLGWDEATPDDPSGLIEEKIERSRRAKHLVKASVLREIAARGKEGDVVQWAQEVLDTGEKLLLFAVHLPMQELLMEALGEHNPAHIFAEDSADTREANIERFRRRDNCRVMVASLGAAKEGVDGLQAASSVVGFTELPWSPADLDQATARLHRMGQEEMVNAYHLIARRTIDERIYNLIREKRSVVDSTTEGSETPLADIRGDRGSVLKAIGKGVGEVGVGGDEALSAEEPEPTESLSFGPDAEERREAKDENSAQATVESEDKADEKTTSTEGERKTKDRKPIPSEEEDVPEAGEQLALF